MIRKAKSAEDFLPIFKEFSTSIYHRYEVAFRFLGPPSGTLIAEPSTVTIEEVTMVDSSPLLNYVYFETGENRFLERYVTFSGPSQAEGFAEEKLTGTMEKYHQILNVIGKRLQLNTDARVSIVGCNSGNGEEKGRIDLSRSRADAVFSYLRYVWGIDPARMEVQARNLPAVPSTNRVKEGIVENQRLEIHCAHPAILDPIKSTYIEEECDAKEIRVVPAIESETVIERWQLKLLGGDKVLTTREGKGNLPTEFVFAVDALGMRTLSALQEIGAQIEIRDNEENVFRTSSAAPTRIDFVRREQRIAQKRGSKVVEKYGLILFEFDRADLKGRNKVIVDRVAVRMGSLPSATMDIIGHMDIIGPEGYNDNINIQLSNRRAGATYEAILKTGIEPGANIGYEGVGPKHPPYDNSLPEGRALNRTVIITIEYTE